MPKKDSSLLVQWTRCNDMVIIWLLNSLSKEIAASVIYSQTAADLWNELEESCECSCGAKEHNHKMLEDQKLIQFLMGLNETYNAVKGNVLMMKPLPTTAHAYSIILHQESQREVPSLRRGRVFGDASTSLYLVQNNCLQI
nr:uncharacterized protein LOC117275164 isoform X2 [Nicotiana tomentosiformis]